MAEITYRRQQHAAHYSEHHPTRGHDLEVWDAQQTWTDPHPEGVPADAEKHSGYLDNAHRPHVLFVRTAPLTGTCARCEGRLFPPEMKP